jgi:hypothetical protein
MGHKDHGFRAVVNGIFYCWDGAGDTLSIRDFLVRIEGDVEIDLWK